jgi:hypothetical protein
MIVDASSSGDPRGQQQPSSPQPVPEGHAAASPPQVGMPGVHAEPLPAQKTAHASPESPPRV